MKHYHIHDTDLFASEFGVDWIISHSNEELPENQREDDSRKEILEGTFFG